MMQICSKKVVLTLESSIALGYGPSFFCTCQCYWSYKTV